MTIISAAESGVEAVAGVATKAVPFYYKILGYFAAAVFLIGVGVVPTAYFVRKYEVDYYTAQIQKADLAAQATILTLTQQKAEVDQQLIEVKNDIQNKYEKQAAADAAAIAKLHASNTKLWLYVANQSGGNTNANNSTGTNSGNGSGTTAVLLPESTTTQLLDLVRQADDLSGRLLACQQWVNNTTQKLSDWEKQTQPKKKK